MHEKVGVHLTSMGQSSGISSSCSEVSREFCRYCRYAEWLAKNDGELLGPQPAYGLTSSAALMLEAVAVANDKGPCGQNGEDIWAGNCWTSRNSAICWVVGGLAMRFAAVGSNDRSDDACPGSARSANHPANPGSARSAWAWSTMLAASVAANTASCGLVRLVRAVSKDWQLWVGSCLGEVVAPWPGVASAFCSALSMRGAFHSAADSPAPIIELCGRASPLVGWHSEGLVASVLGGVIGSDVPSMIWFSGMPVDLEIRMAASRVMAAGAWSTAVGGAVSLISMVGGGVPAWVGGAKTDRGRSGSAVRNGGAESDGIMAEDAGACSDVGLNLTEPARPDSVSGSMLPAAGAGCSHGESSELELESVGGVKLVAKVASRSAGLNLGLTLT
jgi:hypothetical protein